MAFGDSILHVASEVAPFSKTGGLGDVASALPSALARLGHDVTVITPMYQGIEPSPSRVARLAIPLGANMIDVGFHEKAAADGVRTVFVECPALYDREGLYGSGGHDHPDNATRYAVLCRAALEFVRADRWRPTVIHTHDWQAGLVPVYRWTHHAEEPFFEDVALVYTIHNLAYQGTFPDGLVAAGLPATLGRPDALEYWHGISYLKGGINFSHMITTVNPRYAVEMLTPELGFGFEGVLRARRGELVGILNGIDEQRWNPADDPFIPEPFSADDLGGKLAAKRELLYRFELSAEPEALARPVIGMVSRLVDQKGFDLLAQLSDRLGGLGASIVVLGTGDPEHESFWHELASRHPTTIGVRIGFDEGLAHLVEAGADMFLMPSRFEPCGLNQMYSLRYGTAPIVRATGGLADTVEDVDPVTGLGTGFTFTRYDPGALEEALQRALHVFAQPASWRALQLAGMRQDHSWTVSAREYVKVFEGARERARDGWTPPPRR